MSRFIPTPPSTVERWGQHINASRGFTCDTDRKINSPQAKCISHNHTGSTTVGDVLGDDLYRSLRNYVSAQSGELLDKTA